MKRFSSGDQPQRILSALTEAEDFVIDPALQFERSELREFHAYWEQSRGDKNFPQRADIIPIPMPRLLPWTIMFDAVEGGADFTVRVCGTALTDIFGIELRGKSVRLLPETLAARMILSGQRCIALRAPIRGHSQISRAPGQDFQGVEICAVPISNDGETIDMILAVALLATRI
ncbi:MAG TPA: hypothetical protein DCZ06_03135 [Alphaproteobacteria bacterium]|nr:hypothetical protein [Alphaproteobacteria bacterium]